MKNLANTQTLLHHLQSLKVLIFGEDAVPKTELAEHDFAGSEAKAIRGVRESATQPDEGFSYDQGKNSTSN